MTDRPREIVLVGCGHAHLHVIANAAQFRDANARLTIISPDTFWYSGLATGMLGGGYEPTDDTVDVPALVERHGARYRNDHVVGLDRATSRVLLASGDSVAFDRLSINVGSVCTTDHIAGAESHGWTVKPISNLWSLRASLVTRFAQRSATSYRIVVVGGGATGCEVAANLDALARRHRVECRISIFSRGSRLLEEYPDRVGRSMTRALGSRGTITHHPHTGVARLAEGMAIDDQGQMHPADATVLATGLAPSPIVRELGLSVGPDGGLHTDTMLRSVDDERIFGAGDCIDFNGHPLPRIGVFGVRQAPVLLANLLASVDAGAFAQYDPQKRWLSILNLGDGRALAIRRPFHWHGRLSMRLKNRLDTSFLNRFRCDDAER